MAMDQRDLEEAVEKAKAILEEMEKRLAAVEKRLKAQSKPKATKPKQ